MNKKQKILLIAAAYSMFISLVFAVFFSIIFVFIPLSGDLQQVYSVILRVDAVLFGFGAALFIFSIQNHEVKQKTFIYTVVTAAFFSFSVSMMTAFVGLISGELHPFLITPIIPVSFTLTGIFTLVVFLLELGFATDEKKE